MFILKLLARNWLKQVNISKTTTKKIYKKEAFSCSLLPSGTTKKNSCSCFVKESLMRIHFSHWAQEGYWPIHCQWLDILDLRVCHQDKTFLLKELKWNNGLFWRYSAQKAWHVDFYCFVQCKIQILIFITL